MVRRRIPRWLPTLITMVIIVAVMAGLVTVIVCGISTQAEAIGAQAQKAVERIQNWMDELKVSSGFTRWAQEQMEKAWPSIASGIAHELAGSVHGLTSFLVGLFIGFFILMFILADDGSIKRWVAWHLGVEREMGR